MKIQPRSNILLIKKHQNTALKVDIAVEETDADKNLISGEVIIGNTDYPASTGIIFGKYALFKLVLKGQEYFFIDQADIIATTDYIE